MFRSLCETLPVHLIVLIATLFVMLYSCKESTPVIDEAPQPSRNPSTPFAGEQCPPEQLLRELHAAAFHLQHGPVEQGRQHLQQAQELFGERGQSEFGRILVKLSSISERITAEPDRAQRETEHVRLFFSSWKCIPEAMHSRFHEALPPIP